MSISDESKPHAVQKPGSAVIEIYAVKGEKAEVTRAKATVGPILLNALVATNFSARATGGGDALRDVATAIADMEAKVNTGDMREAEQMLAS